MQNVIITAAQIKALRESTSCGLVDCKKALELCCGYDDLAEEYLAKKGLAIACFPHPSDVVLQRARARLAASLT